MTDEKMPEYYCKRLKSNVVAERTEDIAKKIVVACPHYTFFYTQFNGESKNPCNKDSPKFKKCLVKLAVQREEKSKLAQ